MTFLLAGTVLMPPLIGTAAAEVYQTIDKTYTTENAPIAITGSADGKYSFVLSEGGKVYIYSSSGEKNEISVDPGMDHIYASARGDKIYLSSKKSKKVKEIFVDFSHNIDIEGSPFLGSANAPVTIVAFSDFQWPHCAKLTALFEQVLDLYPDSVKIVYKNFPLNMHRFSPTASLAAVAAQEQGKFWQYHDLIFENFRTLSNEKFEEFAKELNLNMPLFNKYMNSKEAKDKVLKDMAIGREIGVSGTPSIFINGRRLRKRSIAGFQKLIDPLLHKN